MKTLNQLNQFEYRSKEEINGWPLIHINIGTNPKTGRSRVAKGVVAIGNSALGVVAIGGAAVGVVTLAGFGFGVVSLAGFSIGVIAFGPVALGYEYSIGAVVLSAKAAIGVIDLAKSFFSGLVGFHFHL
jgi:hypothetical protein